MESFLRGCQLQAESLMMKKSGRSFTICAIFRSREVWVSHRSMVDSPLNRRAPRIQRFPKKLSTGGVNRSARSSGFQAVGEGIGYGVPDDLLVLFAEKVLQ